MLLLKKASLDTEILKNVCPISNLPFASKILEKVVASQLNEYFIQNSSLEPLQSAYCKLHSTETALLSVHNNITRSLDSGNVVLLVLLDLLAAFRYHRSQYFTPTSFQPWYQRSCSTMNSLQPHW